jgi:hypothetical protein
LFRRKNKAITETFTGFTAATLAEAAFAANVLSSEALDAAYLTSETAAAFADNASPALSINLAATTLAEIAFHGQRRRPPPLARRGPLHPH